MKTYIKEALGTCLIVLGAVAPIIFGGQNADVFAQAVAIGVSTLLAIYIFGANGYFNPAITIALAIKGKINKDKMPFYVLAQILGGLLAGATLFVTLRSLGVERAQMGLFAANSFSPEISMYTVFAFETIITLIITAMALRLESRDESLAEKSKMMAFAMTLITLMSTTITSTGANPARSIGLAFFSVEKYHAVKNLPIFVIAPVLGAAIAVYTMKLLGKREN